MLNAPDQNLWEWDRDHIRFPLLDLPETIVPENKEVLIDKTHYSQDHDNVYFPELRENKYKKVKELLKMYCSTHRHPVQQISWQERTSK